MTKNLPSILVQFALLLGAALALTCTSPSSVDCPNGLVCPSGTVCAAAQDVCIANGCGDSVQDTGEVCDDGNVRDGDGCSADCESDETCGNDTTDTAAGEVCDDGNTVDGDDCSADCKSSEVCNNSIVDTSVGEVCDDGNNDSADGCRSDCLSDETCGNGEFDPDVGEACDDGNTVDGDECSSDCSAGEGCGNGFVNEGEICDDGNQIDDDGCAANCLSDETCGNGTIDFAAGEVCDDSNTDSGDGCRSDCQSDETCGNDELDADPGVDPTPEQCDDDGTVDGDGCSHLCQLEVCGNGVTDTDFGETCDDGNTSSGPCVDDPSNPSCADPCTVPGDCDAGFFCSDITGFCDGLDACSSDCRSGQGCGDGNRDATEECDDGDDATYEDNCIVGASGESIRCKLNVCGDGWTDLEFPNIEDCDGDSAGDGGLDPACNLNCTDAVCGDGIVNPMHVGEDSAVLEQCDDDGETQFCNDDCTIAVCGDGVFNATAGEACDDAGNSTDCDADCTLPDCGDGFLNTADGEFCDDGAEVSFDGCSATCVVEPFTLGVTRTGSGAGSVASSIGAISCGNACTEQYLSGASVTLTPTTTTGDKSVFTQWSGGCTGSGACVVSMTASKNVAAQFDLNRLTVARDGSGTGSVGGTGITCGGAGVDCTEDYDNNTVVVLTATPVANSNFTSWAGGGASCTTGACTTTMTGAKTVTATFTLKTFGLTITKSGTGTGTVTSVPSGINCGSGAGCTANFNADSVVTISAAPAANSTFTGWSGGGCPTLTTAPCAVTMSAAQNVTANFVPVVHQITIAKAGTGGGGVTSTSLPSQTNLACGATCSLGYTQDTVLTLTALANTGSTFTSWSGATGCSTSTTCLVTVDAAKTVTATFTVNSYALTVTRTGSGTVTSSPGTINCGSGAGCTNNFDHGTNVSLFAVPTAGHSFSTWGGACSGSGACVVPMDGIKGVSATFTQNTYAFNVFKNGTGGGLITASSGAISCGATCVDTYLSGTTVTLTATPDANSVFTTWNGDCTGASCAPVLNSAKAATATFTLATRNLTVAHSSTGPGTGTGTVSSSPTGINACTASSGTCTAGFPATSLVTLTATPNAGSTFASWSGAAGCTTSPTCAVTMSATQTVTATFAQSSYVLDVVKNGNSTGAIVANSGAVNCGATCTGSYLSGTAVTLTSTPAANTITSAWSVAGCSGNTCLVTMDAAKTVTATYTLVNFDLTIVKTGAGSGTVISLSTPSQTNISCGATCTRPFSSGTSITLQATPGGNDSFVGWSGGGCSGTGDCTITMDQARTVAANFALNGRLLSVTMAGNAASSGGVTSNPAGINCVGANCSFTFSHGTVVALTAVAGANSTFTGWSGEGCSGTGFCIVTMNTARNVTATFVLDTHALTINTGGTGAGTVGCPGTCPDPVNHGTVVTLTASPSTGSDFTGWTVTGFPGLCTTLGNCVLTMNQAYTVTANFTLQSFLLTVVTNTGTGTGDVTANSGTINCPGVDCTDTYIYPTSVILTAVADAGSVFTGWAVTGGGTCAGTGTCTVTMDAIHTVTATFELLTLTVVPAGTGAGTVTSDIGAINCPGVCSDDYLLNDAVVLTAVAGAGDTFTGWAVSGGGVCAGTTPCTVTMSQARTVTATFTD